MPVAASGPSVGPLSRSGRPRQPAFFGRRALVGVTALSAVLAGACVVLPRLRDVEPAGVAMRAGVAAGPEAPAVKPVADLAGPTVTIPSVVSTREPRDASPVRTQWVDSIPSAGGARKPDVDAVLAALRQDSPDLPSAAAAVVPSATPQADLPVHVPGLARDAERGDARTDDGPSRRLRRHRAVADRPVAPERPRHASRRIRRAIEAALPAAPAPRRFVLPDALKPTG